MVMCSNCGTINNDNASVCTTCGSILSQNPRNEIVPKQNLPENVVHEKPVQQEKPVQKEVIDVSANQKLDPSEVDDFFLDKWGDSVKSGVGGVVDNVVSRETRQDLSDKFQNKISYNVEKGKIRERRKAEKKGFGDYDFSAFLRVKDKGLMSSFSWHGNYGTKCYVKLEDDRLIIKKQSGVLNKYTGDRVLFYRDIIMIEYNSNVNMGITKAIKIVLSGSETLYFVSTGPSELLEPWYKEINELWNKNKQSSNAPTQQSINLNQKTSAEELKEWFELYQMGVISQEDFELKKQELMQNKM